MDRWGRSGPVEGGAGQGGSGGQKNFLVGLGLLAPPSSSPTPLNDSFWRAYVRTYVNHDSNAYVHTYVRMQVHRKRLKSVDGGVASLEKRGSETTGRYLRTYERTYLLSGERGGGCCGLSRRRSRRGQIGAPVSVQAWHFLMNSGIVCGTDAEERPCHGQRGARAVLGAWVLLCPLPTTSSLPFVFFLLPPLLCT